MTTPAPVEFTCTAEGMIPTDRQRWLFRKQYVIGRVYSLVPHEERSSASHNHFFAVIHEAWQNLPEQHARRFKTAEHLRKWALIKCGYSDEKIWAFDTPEAALEMQMELRKLYGEFAVIKVTENVVNVFTPKTLRMSGEGAMTKEQFQRAKNDVLEYVASLIGVTAKTLSDQVKHSPQSDAASEADKPAADQALASAAGNQPPPKWMAKYLQYLEEPTEDPRSLKRRHDEAIAAIGGTPSEADLTLMRRVYGFRQRNISGSMTHDQYQQELRKLGAIA